MAGAINEVTDTNFQAEVLESDKPVLVDFWAPGAVPAGSSPPTSRSWRASARTSRS